MPPPPAARSPHSPSDRDAKSRRKGEAEGLPEGGEGKEDGGDAASSSAGGYQLWSAMAKETEALKRQLARLSGDPRFKVRRCWLLLLLGGVG